MRARARHHSPSLQSVRTLISPSCHPLVPGQSTNNWETTVASRQFLPQKSQKMSLTPVLTDMVFSSTIVPSAFLFRTVLTTKFPTLSPFSKLSHAFHTLGWHHQQQDGGRGGGGEGCYVNRNSIVSSTLRLCRWLQASAGHTYQQF